MSNSEPERISDAWAKAEKNARPLSAQTAAMQRLQRGVDRTIIALWLGHEAIETTQVYIHADIELKDRAMALTKPVDQTTGRYRPGDELLAILQAL